MHETFTFPRSSRMMCFNSFSKKSEKSGNLFLRSHGFNLNFCATEYVIFNTKENNVKNRNVE